MKKIKLLIASIFFIMLSTGVMAQPPDPPEGHGEGDDELPGGGAPIGGGLFMLLGLGVAYGGRKFYKMKEQSTEE